MPDPTISDAYAEAIALAPADEVEIDTLEIRHPSFVDEAGNPDSIWITTNEVDIIAAVEANAPVKGGLMTLFRSLGFSFTLAGIQPGVGAEIEIRVDNVDRRIVRSIKQAAKEQTKIIMCYRPYLSSDLDGGPQMMPAPEYELRECDADSLNVIGRARVAIDLAGPFPRWFYTANEYPGLLGQ